MEDNKKKGQADKKRPSRGGRSSRGGEYFNFSVKGKLGGQGDRGKKTPEDKAPGPIQGGLGKKTPEDKAPGPIQGGLGKMTPEDKAPGPIQGGLGKKTPEIDPCKKDQGKIQEGKIVPSQKSQEIASPQRKFQEKNLSELSEFVERILSPSLPERAKVYAGPKYISVWQTAFTHETWSSGDNYEELEFLGDAVLKAVFPVYMRKLFPDLKKSEYTALNTNYMSKMKQGQLSNHLGLPSRARIRNLTGKSFNVDADLFESFFGALYEIADEEYGLGAGFRDCYLMLTSMIKEEDIKSEDTEGHAKSVLMQMFTRQGLPEPEESTNAVTGQAGGKVITNEITLTDEHLGLLRDYQGVILDSPLIGRGVSGTKRGASAEAYRDALATLAKVGVTRESMEKIKRRRDLEDPALEEYIGPLAAKLKADNYRGPHFFTPRKLHTTANIVIQLMAFTKDNQRKMLASITADDQPSGRLAVIKQYLSS